MIIRDFNVVGIAILETKADSPLVVDGDGVLTFPFPFQCVKAIARGHPKVIKECGQVNVLQTSHRPAQ